MTKKKQYYIETDLIEISGKLAIEKISEGENTIYLNLEKIEALADDQKNYRREQFQEALNYILRGEIYEKEKYILLENKGILRWDYEELSIREKKRIHHITRNKGRQLYLKRKGFVCEIPRYLMYLSNVFEQSFLDLECNIGNIFKISLTDLKKQYPEENFFNNQLIRLRKSNNLIYKVEYPIKQISEDRYEIDRNGKGKLNRFNKINQEYFGFKPRETIQEIAYQTLHDPDIEVHFVVGGSGSGKTVLSYAAALNQVLSYSEKPAKYDGILLFKASDIIGGRYRDEGFLPGSAYEKAKPYLQSYIDAHRLLGYDLTNHGGISFDNLLADPFNENDEFGRRKQNKIFKRYLPPKRKAIEVAHLRFSRGRTFENLIILVDEAQNYTPFEIKQLIERVGKGSKIIIIGDPNQVDNPSLDKNFNGLTYSANVFMNKHPKMNIIRLDKNYRSQSAQIMRDEKTPKV
jgi:predicted ribonuclease YlaK